jgi:hypothetical protein
MRRLLTGQTAKELRVLPCHVGSPDAIVLKQMAQYSHISPSYHAAEKELSRRITPLKTENTYPHKRLSNQTRFISVNLWLTSFSSKRLEKGDECLTICL